MRWALTFEINSRLDGKDSALQWTQFPSSKQTKNSCCFAAYLMLVKVLLSSTESIGSHHSALQTHTSLEKLHFGCRKADYWWDSSPGEESLCPSDTHCEAKRSISDETFNRGFKIPALLDSSNLGCEGPRVIPDPTQVKAGEKRKLFGFFNSCCSHANVQKPVNFESLWVESSEQSEPTI